MDQKNKEIFDSKVALLLSIQHMYIGYNNEINYRINVFKNFFKTYENIEAAWYLSTDVNHEEFLDKFKQNPNVHKLELYTIM